MHAPLPFQSFIGDPLLEAMTAKIEISGSLEQRLWFFLYSYSEIDIMGRLPAMPTVIDVSDLMNDGEEDADKEEEDDAFEESYVEKVALSNIRITLPCIRKY
eukprot:795520_1